jgi:hypothetical protein
LKIEQRTAFLKKLLQESGLSEYGMDDTEIQKIASRPTNITVIEFIMKLKKLAAFKGYSVKDVE